MKKITILLLMMLSCIIAVQTYADGKPSIAIPVKSYDFGTIREENGSVSCKFSFTNNGNAPLVILSATASCGCTKPSYPYAPIQPGESGEIKVTYNPRNRPGEFSKNIVVRTNDPKNKKINLKITGIVLPKK